MHYLTQRVRKINQYSFNSNNVIQVKKVKRTKTHRGQKKLLATNNKQNFLKVQK